MELPSSPPILTVEKMHFLMCLKMDLLFGSLKGLVITTQKHNTRKVGNLGDRDLQIHKYFKFFSLVQQKQYEIE